MKKPFASATITSAYQVSIPKRVREKLNAEVGDILLFFTNKDGEVIIKTTV